MTDAATRRVRRTASDWEQIFAAFEHSGLSQTAFCRREGLALSTFQHWKRRLAACEQTQPSPEQPAMIELGSLDDRSAGWEVEIKLGDGVSLTLRRR